MVFYQTAISVWPTGDKVPGERVGTIGAEYETCLTGGVKPADCKDRSVHNVTVPTLTPFIVPGATSAVIVAPGGAYSILAVDREGFDIAAWLNSIGVSAFVLKYRVPARSWLPFGGAPLMDAQRSLGLVRQMAAAGKIQGMNSTSKVGFMGFSAGSHLTGHVNVAWKTRTYPHIDAADTLSCRPDFSLMIYPYATMTIVLGVMRPLLHKCTGWSRWESVTQAPVSASREQASALNVTNTTPPTMIVQAEDDPVHVENALFYFYALKVAGAAPSELHVYPSGGHGYGRCTNPGHSWHEVRSRFSLMLLLLIVCTHQTT